MTHIDPEALVASLRRLQKDRSATGIVHHLERIVQVVDRPGTDADEAVYRIAGVGGHEHDVVLKRSGAGWAS